MRFNQPASPVQFDIRMLAGLVDNDAHPLDQEAGDPLPLGLGGRGPPPDRGQVACQGADDSLILGGEPPRRRPTPSFVLLFELSTPLERFLPATLQLAPDQTILRLTGLVLAGCPADFMIGPRATQLPMPGQFGPLSLHFSHRCQACLKRGGLDGRQNSGSDQLVERWAGKALAEGFSGARGTAGTRIRVKILRP